VLGIPGLDKGLSEHLPEAWLALAIGRSGSPTNLLAKQFAHAAAPGTPVTYYTTYERTEDVQRAFQEFEWPIDQMRIVNLAQDYYEGVLVRDLEVSKARESGLKFADLAPSKSPAEGRRTFNLTNRLYADLAAMDGRFRVALDSLDFLIEILQGPSVMTVARQIRHRAQALGGQALLVVQGDIHDRATIGLLEDLADIVVVFDTQELGDGHVHKLSLRKVRNHPEMTRTVVTKLTAAGLDVGPSASD
jgi:KaiC/GvpD/RAD55 family RecA-like ATPase